MKRTRRAKGFTSWFVKNYLQNNVRNLGLRATNTSRIAREGIHHFPLNRPVREYELGLHFFYLYGIDSEEFKKHGYPLTGPTIVRGLRKLCKALGDYGGDDEIACHHPPALQLIDCERLGKGLTHPHQDDLLIAVHNYYPVDPPRKDERYLMLPREELVAEVKVGKDEFKGVLQGSDSAFGTWDELITEDRTDEGTSDRKMRYESVELGLLLMMKASKLLLKKG
ncbi:MAG: hypothetical protein ACE5FW_01310 [Candidatus Aenigmatarchaeota archaeon]